MDVFGREVHFLFSVGAEQEIANLCPDGKLTDMKQLLTRDAEHNNGRELICILSRWAEKARAYLDPDYTPQPLTREQVDLLPMNEFRDLLTEALRAMARDQKPTVEAEAAKKDAAPGSN